MICCPAEGWHGSRCVLRREFNVLQPNFSLQLIWKKWTTCRLSLAARERPHAMYQSVFDCYKSDSSQTVHMTRKWKKMVNKLRRQRSPWHARSIFWPSQPIRRRGIGLKCAPQRGRVNNTMSRGNGRFSISIFSCSFFRSSLQVLDLQVSKSDSRSGSMRTLPNSCPGMCIYVVLALRVNDYLNLSLTVRLSSQSTRAASVIICRLQKSAICRLQKSVTAE